MAATPVAPEVVRLRSAPVHDPPYDDERPAGWWPAGGQPPLDLPPPLPAGGQGPQPAPRPARPSGNGVRGNGAPGNGAPATTAAVRFVNTCLEILNGYRPVAHLRALARPREAAAVVAAMTHATRLVRPAVRQGRLVRLRTMRTCEPRPGVAEIAVVVGVGPGRGRPEGAYPDAGRPVPAGRRDLAVGPDRAVGTDRAAVPDRAWALTYRLERRHDGWQCIAAQLLAPAR